MKKKQKEEISQTTESSINGDKQTSAKNTEVDPSIEAAIQLKLNELRQEYLNDRSDSINRWLGVIGIVLAFFGLMVPIAAYIAYERFQSFESQARRHVDEAREFLQKIEGHEKTAKEILLGLTSEDVDKPETIGTLRKVIQETLRNPNSSFEEKVRAEALRLQDIGKSTEAVEIWKSLASVAEGVDNEVAANAWFSIGHLHQKANKEDEALSAYNKAISLKPDYVKAYNNRGVIKKELGQFEDAIKDYDIALHLRPNYYAPLYNRGNAKSSLKQYESALVDYNAALRQKPDYAMAYSSRGQVKRILGEYESALKDCDKAIQLKPDLAYAYSNRGKLKSDMGEIEGAKKDFQIALELAKQQGEEKLKVYVEKQIQKLNSVE